MGGLFDAAFGAILRDPSYGRDAVYRINGVGDGAGIRVVPVPQDDEDNLGGAFGDAGRATFGRGRSFRARLADFPGSGPKTGDTIEVDGRLWVVRRSTERWPLSSIWQIECSPAS